MALSLKRQSLKLWMPTSCAASIFVVLPCCGILTGHNIKWSIPILPSYKTKFSNKIQISAAMSRCGCLAATVITVITFYGLPQKIAPLPLRNHCSNHSFSIKYSSHVSKWKACSYFFRQPFDVKVNDVLKSKKKTFNFFQSLQMCNNCDG